MSASLSLQFAQSDKSFFVQERVTAGVSRMCDLNLAYYFEDPLRTISRHHFQITNSDEGFFIVDLHSLNGTEVNNEPLFPRTPQFLRHGDLIRVAQNKNFLIHVMLKHETRGTRRLEQAIQRKIHKSGIDFDEKNGCFFVDGKPVPHTYFTELEHRLLCHLYQNVERVCSYHSLAEHVWGGMAQDNTIARCIAHLRQKLSLISGGDRESYIETARGYIRGYMLKQA